MYKVISFLTILILFSAMFVSCTKSPEETKPAPEAIKSPASFTVSNLTITPATINPDEKVTISVDVTNTGETAGNYTAVLNINGIQEATQDVTLDGGASKKVDFSVSQSTAGDYTVSLDTLTGKFTVVVKPPPTKTATLTDAEFTVLSHLWTGEVGAEYSIQFLSGNKMKVTIMRTYHYTADIKVCDGKFCVDNFPPPGWDYIYSHARAYFIYNNKDLMTLVSLTEKLSQTMFGPDVKVLPTIVSITTSEGSITFTYLVP